MSAIATFYVFDISNLKELGSSKNYSKDKTLLAKVKIVFEGSGFVYNNLFTFLIEQKEIDLITGNEHDPLAKQLNELSGSLINLILTFDQKQQFEARLDPTTISVAELIEYNTDFSGEDDPELAEMQIAGIATLQNAFRLLENGQQVIMFEMDSYYKRLLGVLE